MTSMNIFSGDDKTILLSHGLVEAYLIELLDARSVEEYGHALPIKGRRSKGFEP